MQHAATMSREAMGVVRRIVGRDSAVVGVVDDAIDAARRRRRHTRSVEKLGNHTEMARLRIGGVLMCMFDDPCAVGGIGGGGKVGFTAQELERPTPRVLRRGMRSDQPACGGGGEGVTLVWWAGDDAGDGGGLGGEKKPARRGKVEGRPIGDDATDGLAADRQINRPKTLGDGLGAKEKRLGEERCGESREIRPQAWADPEEWACMHIGGCDGLSQLREESDGRDGGRCKKLMESAPTE